MENKNSSLLQRCILWKKSALILIKTFIIINNCRNLSIKLPSLSREENFLKENRIAEKKVLKLNAKLKMVKKN